MSDTEGKEAEEWRCGEIKKEEKRKKKFLLRVSAEFGQVLPFWAEGENALKE